MLGFVASPISAFRWKKFIQGVTAIILDVVKMFYKGYMNEEERYAMVKGQKVDFGPDTINKLFGLKENKI